MAPVVTDNTFGFSSGTGGVENIKRVVGLDGYRISRGGVGHDLVPVKVSAFLHGCLDLRPLEYHAGFRFVA